MMTSRFVSTKLFEIDNGIGRLSAGPPNQLFVGGYSSYAVLDILAPGRLELVGNIEVPGRLLDLIWCGTSLYVLLDVSSDGRQAAIFSVQGWQEIAAMPRGRGWTFVRSCSSDSNSLWLVNGSIGTSTAEIVSVSLSERRLVSKRKLTQLGAFNVSENGEFLALSVPTLGKLNKVVISEYSKTADRVLSNFHVPAQVSNLSAFCATSADGFYIGGCTKTRKELWFGHVRQNKIVNHCTVRLSDIFSLDDIDSEGLSPEEGAPDLHNILSIYPPSQDGCQNVVAVVGGSLYHGARDSSASTVLQITPDISGLVDKCSVGSSDVLEGIRSSLILGQHLYCMREGTLFSICLTGNGN